MSGGERFQPAGFAASRARSSVPTADIPTARPQPPSFGFRLRSSRHHPPGRRDLDVGKSIPHRLPLLLDPLLG